MIFTVSLQIQETIEEYFKGKFTVVLLDHIKQRPLP